MMGIRSIRHLPEGTHLLHLSPSSLDSFWVVGLERLLDEVRRTCLRYLFHRGRDSLSYRWKWTYILEKVET